MDENKIVDFFHCVSSLKTTFRYMESVAGRKESTAEHSWRLSLMVYIVMSELGYQSDWILRSIAIALVHDLPEAKTGDIDALLVYNGTISKIEKQANERDALQEIVSHLPIESGEHARLLWEEYEFGETEESRIVKALDKIETLLHVIDGYLENINDPEFTAHYADAAVLKCPKLLPLLVAVKYRLRQRYESLGVQWKEEYGEIAVNR